MENKLVMTIVHKIVFLIVMLLAAFVCMLVYPPWCQGDPPLRDWDKSNFVDQRWLWDPPKGRWSWDSPKVEVKICWGMIESQMMAVAFLITISYIVALIAIKYYRDRARRLSK